jgi:hypothetical protein
MGFDWKAFAGDRFKFEKPGDAIEGKVVLLTATDFGDGPVPVVTLATDTGNKEVTASQRILQQKLAAQAPEVGDWVRITFDGEDHARARPGRSPAKLFTVVVKRDSGGGEAVPPPPVGAPPPELPESWGDEPF